MQDASHYGPAEIAALAKLADAGLLPIRVYATVSNDAKDLPGFFARGQRIGQGNDFLTVRAIKVLADGALGSRGAALLSDYSDDPGNRGLLVTSPDRVAELAREARRHGWQLWIHAIGDRGNRVALDAFAKAAAEQPDAPPGAKRPRIEHAQVVAPEDIPRFAAGGRHRLDSADPRHLGHAVGAGARGGRAHRGRVRVAAAEERPERGSPAAATFRWNRRTPCSGSTLR